MRIFRVLSACGCVFLANAARAVYAPIPLEEQGKEFTYSLSTGVSYDSNIFAAPTDAISSWVYEVTGQINFNASLSQQTFSSASYKLTLDYLENRPGKKLLDGHDATARLAHAFTQATSIDLNEAFKIARNPSADLNGVPINTDQSYLSNQFDARFTTTVAEKTSLVLKARTVYYDYFNTLLGDELNRFENLYGLETNYAFLPELKIAGEYRHQDIDYSSFPATNNKHSDFLMAGFDYSEGPKISFSTRVGAEFRRRDGGDNETAPYVEISGKYDYAKQSFISAGYVYDLTETSDPIDFTDEKTNRFFINVQHAISAFIIVSASVDYEPGTLLSRGPAYTQVPTISETSTHDGLALTYLPNKNWTITATYDYDHTSSGLASRDLIRSRGGVNAKFTF